ncbi:MAG: 2-hydroxychromene-2-carboxylate isomerase [Burkholderiaceae bacterium]
MIEFFFDCSSPWTYLAFHNIQPMAAEIGVPICWRPILVGGVFNAVNPSVYAARDNPVPAKQAYMVKDLADWSRQAGLTIRMPPSVFPVNSVKVMRACLWLLPQLRMLPFARVAFEAYWSLDRDISDDAVLRELCKQCALEPSALLAGITEGNIKNQLKANTEELVRRGGFGSPTMFIGDDMYFGNDRLELVRAAALRQKARR